MAMDPKTVELRALRAHSLQRVLLTFTHSGESIAGLIDLLRMHQKGEIKIHQSDYIVVLAVVQSRDWDRPENCRVSVYFQPTCSAPWFGRLVSPHLEQMEPHTPHAVKPIMTRKQQKQAEGASAIIDACLTADLMREARGWGMDIKGELDTSQPGLPSVVFKVTENRTTGAILAATVVLDGWSGRIFLNDKGYEEMVTDLASVTAFLKRRIDNYVEKTLGS